MSACCRNPVKFWFIKNYMSPQMKRFVPEMAQHYNFHYQFVTYKWPSFLHKQVRSCSCMCSCCAQGFGFSGVCGFRSRDLGHLV